MYKLIFNIFACGTIKKYKDEILKINETWGKIAEELGIKILFFLGEEPTDLIDKDKYIYLKDVDNTYSSAAHKQYLGLKYIYENYNTEFIFTCGTDTYPNIKKLLLYINKFNKNDLLYIGGDDGIRYINNEKIIYHSGGAGFLITNTLLSKLYSNISIIQNQWELLCNSNDNYLIDACDVSIAYYINKIPNVKMIEKQNSFYACNYKGFGMNNNNLIKCCSDKINVGNIISCHYMSLEDFDKYTNMLIKNNYFVDYSIEFIKNKYTNLCNNYSDIFEHLPTLYKYATKCETIIELGVRGCISSWALAYGLLNNNKSTKYLLLNDIEKCNINELLENTSDLDINISYEWINDLNLDIKSNVDLTFIDTWHVYGQLKRELDKFSKITNKYIIMHDTTVDEIVGETIRNGWNPIEQSISSGIPVDEITCGLWKAIEEFLENNKQWVLKERYVNNNGLTILEKIN